MSENDNLTGNLQGIDPEDDYEVGYGKPPKKSQFKPGDKRINRNGKPKSFAALRKLMQEQAGEIALDANGNPITDKNGRPRTNAARFVEAWMKDRKQRKAFAEFAWGKPKEEIDINQKGDLKVIIEYADDKDNPAEITPGTDPDQDGTQEA
jgi:endo-alpha-1,4-polygalactosaminidase (GH114 family)